MYKIVGDGVMLAAIESAEKQMIGFQSYKKGVAYRLADDSRVIVTWGDITTLVHIDSQGNVLCFIGSYLD